MMITTRRSKSLAAIAGLLGAAVLTACGTSAGSGPAPHPHRPTAQPQAKANAKAIVLGRARFSAPTRVSNPMFPMAPGSELRYQGRIVADGRSTPHSNVFIITDLTKIVDGVQTVVAWDKDFLRGRLQEQELAFFAQDDQGNLWNFGEYPEEYHGGRLTGAPDTWIKGRKGSYGGIHMLAKPMPGDHYLEGLIPSIEFNDVSRVARVGQAACTRSRCYHRVLMIDEWSPNDPAGGHQLKYYAPRVGLVRVGARGGDSREFLSLVAVRHLTGTRLAAVRSAVLAMDHRAYRVSKVYRVTRPAVQGGA